MDSRIPTARLQEWTLTMHRLKSPKRRPVLEPRDLLLIGILLLIGLTVTDCTLGKTRHCAGIVRQHVYKPAYTSQNCHTDSKGNTTCDQTYHAAEYRLLIYVPAPEHSTSIDDQLMYMRYGDGAAVTVGERCGRWTGFVYLDWIVKNQPIATHDDRTY